MKMKSKTVRVWITGLLTLALIAGVVATCAANTSGSRSAAQAVGSAKDLSKAFRFAADKVLPSVVTIEHRPAIGWKTTGHQGRPGSPQQNPFKGSPFEHLFPDSGQGPRSPSPRPSLGMGSGVIVDSSGLIMTNNHVVAGGGDVTVRLHDGREFVATEVWTDPKTDIAVVKIDGADDLVAAAIGNSDFMEVGDWVLALGQPFGLESTVTAGIISAKHRGIGITARENFLQTDAAINPGNSGGPLVNLDGEIVGINTAISSRSGGYDGIGFTVPINLATWVADQLARDGTVHRAYLGVGIQPVTAQLAEQFQVQPREGVVVTDVYPDTPADKAGVRSGDVIVDFAGQPIETPQALQVVVERSEIGKALPLTVVRDGQPMTLRFIAEEQPNSFGATRSGNRAETLRPRPSRLDRLGLEVSPLDPEVADKLGMEGVEGVVITAVQNGSPAERAGLTGGMVITEVNRNPVTSVQDAQNALDPMQEGVLLLVRTEGGSRFVALKP